jgi:hypothetical protein
MKLNIISSALVLVLSVSVCRGESSEMHNNKEDSIMVRLGWDTIGHLLNEQIDSTHTAHEEFPAWEMWLGCGLGLLGMLLIIPSALQLKRAGGNAASSYEQQQGASKPDCSQQYEYDLSYSERSYFSPSDNTSSRVRRRSFPRSYGV